MDYDLIDVLGIDRTKGDTLKELGEGLAGYTLTVSRWQDTEAPLAGVNREYQAKPGIKDTVWSNYELVGVQHPVPAGDQTEADCKFEKVLRVKNAGSAVCEEVETVTAKVSVKPVTDINRRSVANTTMETHLQGVSCLACHGGTRRAARDSDDKVYLNANGQLLFAFLFSRGPADLKTATIKPPSPPPAAK